MRRFALAGAVALVLSATAALPADLQATENDRPRFVGTWDLVSVEAQWPDGHVTAPWGAHPPGRLIYTGDGHVSALLMHELRNQASHGGVTAALQNEAAGYFGTYTVDTARHVVSHHVAATLRAAEAGTIDRAYRFEGENLTLTAKATRDRLPVTYVLVWKRAAKP
ncbi:MAG TPA: lipocalin-like domain-containing protein [Rhizomicrobium sp.]